MPKSEAQLQATQKELMKFCEELHAIAGRVKSACRIADYSDEYYTAVSLASEIPALVLGIKQNATALGRELERGGL